MLTNIDSAKYDLEKGRLSKDHALITRTHAIAVRVANTMRRGAVSRSTSADIAIRRGIWLLGSENTIADAVSRLPLPMTREEPPRPAEVVHLMEYLDASPVTSSQIRLWTDQDPILVKVKGWVLSGWPEKPPEEEKLRAYFHRKREFIVEDGCLLWGSRVVVPEKGRRRVVSMLHQAHPGISRMKSLAMFGGRELMEIWSCVSSLAKHAKLIKNPHQLYHYIHGPGLTITSLGR